MAKDTSPAQEALIDIFEQIENFFNVWRPIRGLTKRRDDGHRREDDGRGTEHSGYCVEDEPVSFFISQFESPQ